MPPRIPAGELLVAAPHGTTLFAGGFPIPAAGDNTAMRQLAAKVFVVTLGIVLDLDPGQEDVPTVLFPAKESEG